MEWLLQYDSSSEDSREGSPRPPSQGDVAAHKAHPLKRQRSDAQETSTPTLIPEAKECLAQQNNKPRVHPATASKRIRSFPHVEGNFPTHVFIPVDIPPTARAAWAELISQVNRQVPPGQQLEGCDATAQHGTSTTSGGMPIAAPGAARDVGYHLSLSRTVAVRYSQIDPLVKMLQHHLRNSSGFAVQLKGLRVLVNEECTRTFLTVPVTAGEPQVCQLIAAVDDAFTKHGLRRFYEEPQPHVSIAWASGDQRQAMQDVIDGTAPPAATRSLQWMMKVTSVICRVGQRDYTVWSSL